MGRRVGWAAAVGCYVIAAIAGMYVLADDAGLAVQVALWVVHGVLLFLGIRKFGARESSSYAALFIVVVSSLAVGVAGMAREDLTLQQRGETVVATVVGERFDPPDGRKGRHSYYTLEHEDGTGVPGPEMRTTSDLYDAGQTVTVIEDPEADLRPQTPGQADATGEVLGAAAFALAAVGSVVWMAWRGARAETATVEAVAADTARREQEERLRAALHTYQADRRGYIKMSPEEFPGLSHSRAARIAWEMGLKAEAFGNRGSWRFSEMVIEEVPHH
ncbi:hypothetical protein G3I18_25020 [Actinospica acidiphila]|uniref:Uncharacterized protein n=1 Tax=Actinospica acidiphila TaxID=304899 RepID=A0A9X5HEF2_9ACTN|nr:hypothetical protein [Actinospica acidiphila]NEC51798.1 hypothetical protein [Actinospica acidiphila]